MIGWVTAIVPFAHSSPVSGGRTVVIDADGTVEWNSPRLRALEGSFASRLMVRTAADPGYLLVSGNPAKWLQGHNLFGSDDLVGLVLSALDRATVSLNLDPSAADRHAWATGDYQLTRVDCTAMWHLRTRSDVRSYLRALERQARSRHGRPVSRGGTVYFGKNSRRWALKAYSKGDELDVRAKGHALPDGIPFRDELLAFADCAVRFELTLRSMALKDRGLSRAAAWANIDALTLLQDSIGKLDMADQFSLSPAALEGLPPRLILVYEAWRAGKDLRQFFPARTFYRYRKELLTRGIDINIRQPAHDENVVSLIRALRPEALARVPDWARSTCVYFEPATSPHAA